MILEWEQQLDLLNLFQTRILFPCFRLLGTSLKNKLKNRHFKTCALFLSHFQLCPPTRKKQNVLLCREWQHITQFVSQSKKLHTWICALPTSFSTVPTREKEKPRYSTESDSISLSLFHSVKKLHTRICAALPIDTDSEKSHKGLGFLSRSHHQFHFLLTRPLFSSLIVNQSSLAAHGDQSFHLFGTHAYRWSVKQISVITVKVPKIVCLPFSFQSKPFLMVTFRWQDWWWQWCT